MIDWVVQVGVIGGVLGAAYLLGSLPTGYIVAKVVQGIDIREHGSGNPGATNVLRVVGKKAGLTVLVVDLLKGTLAVLLARQVLPIWITADSSLERLAWVIALAGLMAVVGHSCSIWLNFTGGKSVATGLGVLLGLAWPVGLAAAAVFASLLAIFRIVSIGSIAAAVAAPVFMLMTHQPLAYCLLVLSAGGYIVWRHRSNINRLLAGNEPRLGMKASDS